MSNCLRVFSMFSRPCVAHQLRSWRSNLHVCPYQITKQIYCCGLGRVIITGLVYRILLQGFTSPTAPSPFPNVLNRICIQFKCSNCFSHIECSYSYRQLTYSIKENVLLMHNADNLFFSSLMKLNRKFYLGYLSFTFILLSLGTWMCASANGQTCFEA